MFLRRNKQNFHDRKTLREERQLRRNGPCVKRRFIITRYPIGSCKHKQHSHWLVFSRSNIRSNRSHQGFLETLEMFVRCNKRDRNSTWTFSSFIGYPSIHPSDVIYISFPVFLRSSLTPREFAWPNFMCKVELFGKTKLKKKNTFVKVLMKSWSRVLYKVVFYK